MRERSIPNSSSSQRLLKKEDLSTSDKVTPSFRLFTIFSCNFCARFLIKSLSKLLSNKK